MKFLISTIFLASTMFASSSFKDNIKYKCLNSYNIQKGERFDVPKDVASKNPLFITIKDNKIHTSENSVFSFLMKKDDMRSFSDKDFMVLLTSNKTMGLVPKKARGQLQYYFSCK